jgi:hypothetical protein
VQLGKEKAFKDLCNLKSKINDVPIGKQKNMEVKFNKAWLKREGFQRPFSAARQLPREMSIGEGVRSRETTKAHPCQSAKARLGQASSEEPSQIGGGDDWIERNAPRKRNSHTSGMAQALCLSRRQKSR